jgi:hypothetical protein
MPGLLQNHIAAATVAALDIDGATAAKRAADIRGA